MRGISIVPGFIENAEGSVLMETGKTRVICTASVEDGVPRFLADQGLTLDPINPQVAARLLGPLGPWRRFDAARGALMKTQLERILNNGRALSADVYEIASKSLGT